MDQQNTGPLQGGIANLTNAGKGRKKGVPNKTTKLAKEAIAEAFDQLGGTTALVTWAQANDDNLKVFYASIWPKLVPVQTEISGKDGEAIQFEQVNEDAHAFRRRLLSGAISGTATGSPGDTIN
jgi:hypothetical protein